MLIRHRAIYFPCVRYNRNVTEIFREKTGGEEYGRSYDI